MYAHTHINNCACLTKRCGSVYISSPPTTLPPHSFAVSDKESIGRKTKQCPCKQTTVTFRLKI